MIPRLPGRHPALGPLAQSVEHLTFNQVVEGSIPSRPTNEFSESLEFQPEPETAYHHHVTAAPRFALIPVDRR